LEQTAQLPTVEIGSSPDIVWNKLTTLPSKFLPYKENMVHWRPLTFHEMQGLNIANLTNEDAEMIASKAISGIDPEELSTDDLRFITNYIAFQTTPGKTWNPTFTCAKCNKPNTVQLSPKDLQFRDLEVKALPVVITDHQDKELHLSVFRKKHRNLVIKAVENGARLDHAILAARIENFPFDEALSYIENLEDVETGQMIEAVDRELFHGLIPRENVCLNPDDEQIKTINDQRKKKKKAPLGDGDSKPSCGYRYSFNVDFEVIDILPFRTLGNFDRNRIRFGLSR